MMHHGTTLLRCVGGDARRVMDGRPPRSTDRPPRSTDRYTTYGEAQNKHYFNMASYMHIGHFSVRAGRLSKGELPLPELRCGVRCALHPVDLSGISLCDVCSCHEILRAQRTRVGEFWRRPWPWCTTPPSRCDDMHTHMTT
eukprot:SAG25_NODE_3517_length_1053_cov_1.832285_1_plen_140_part_01